MSRPTRSSEWVVGLSAERTHIPHRRLLASGRQARPRQPDVRRKSFTPWLLANADRLAEALGIDLELEAAEHAVGGYSLDLVGKDITNDAVLIVENQLSGTDHSHLGQVLTYAAGT